MAVSSSPIKKSVIIIVAVALAPMVLVGLVAIAAGGWRQIGSTANGDEILVSSVTAPRKGVRTAWVRVEYKEPAKLPQGGPFVELRARARFDCSGGGVTPSVVANSEWFYSRDRGGKLVVSKKTRHDDQFGQLSEGGFGNIAKDFVCKQK